MNENSDKSKNDFKLHYNVMGIALAIWAKAGKCYLFNKIDRALDDFDTEALQVIKGAFSILPDNVKDIILYDTGSEKRTKLAISSFEKNLFELEKALGKQS